MKQNYIKSFSLAAALLAASVVPGFGQYVFSGTVIGQSDPDVGPLSASVTIDFTQWEDGVVEVNVENLGPTTSKLTAFYMAAPLDTDTTPVNDFMLALAPISDPLTWTVQNASQDFGSPDDAFFGANTHVNTDPLVYPVPYPQDPTWGSGGEFYFYSQTLADATSIDLSPYMDIANVTVLVRWQTVGDDGEASGKGWGYGRNFEPAIPEPAHVASLAVAGLAGLLFLRRRLTAKKK